MLLIERVECRSGPKKHLLLVRCGDACCGTLESRRNDFLPVPEASEVRL